MSIPDIDAFSIKAEKLCRTVAPLDLGDTPLYIVPQSRLPAAKSQCEGYTTGSLDLYCRQAIGRAWRGRGACMVINDTELGEMDRIDRELYFQTIAIHELAHILERPALYQDRPEIVFVPRHQATGDAQANLDREAAHVAKLVADDVPEVERFVPFLGHGARFIRTALHLCHRAQAAGVEFAPSAVCCGSSYGLSHALCYRKALGTEPRRMIGARMHEILRSPAPKAFTRLWTADVVHWFSVCPLYGERMFA